MRNPIFLVAVGLAGCAGESTATSTAPSEAMPTASPAAAHGGGARDEDAAARRGTGECTEHAGEPVEHPDSAVVVDAGGAKVTVAGEKLAGVPAVSVAELVGRPEAYAGKTVRLEGNVSAMCTHLRGWFAVQTPDRSGRYVRVLTAPKFLVPENALGTRVRTEGVVELVETDPAQAQHYAQEHRLAAPAVRTAVVRATGAEFL